jgi:hypothetical protein
MKIPVQNVFGIVVFMSTLLSCGPGRRVASTSPGNAKDISKTDQFFSQLLESDPFLSDSILKNKDDLRLQIIYTQIDRGKKGEPKFTDHYFNVDTNTYFYPASTVKLPIALLALQKLHDLNIPGLDRNTTMITEADYSGQTPVYNDPTTADGRPTVANYIKKIFLASDNDAFNRLYEFLGQEYINNTLHQMGYVDAQILHRLNISLSEDQNRHTNPVRFFDASGKMIYEKPAEFSRLVYASRNTKLGNGYLSDDKIINEPLDFSKKNRLSLYDLHSIMRSVIFPKAVPANQRFHLSEDDYAFVRKYMSMFPRESQYPFYDNTEYSDTYVKFLLFGGAKKWPDSNIRIFNKPGDAYGFMLDIDYVADFKNKIEFMVSAVIYCNSDGILNDDKYDYETIGHPFYRHLGQVIYNYELNRKRKHSPDLSSMIFNYAEQNP